MYTYDQILKIKNDLNDLIPLLEARGLPVIAEGEHISEHIKQYDVVLEQIGKNGICTDSNLCRGFAETEKLLKAINNNVE